MFPKVMEFAAILPVFVNLCEGRTLDDAKVAKSRTFTRACARPIFTIFALVELIAGLRIRPNSHRPA